MCTLDLATFCISRSCLVGPLPAGHPFMQAEQGKTALMIPELAPCCSTQFPSVPDWSTLFRFFSLSLHGSEGGRRWGLMMV